MKHYDVVIAGGGVSGMMMAKRLSMLLPHLSVAIINKGSMVEHSFHLHKPIPELTSQWVEKKFHLGVWGETGTVREVSPADINSYAIKTHGRICPSNIINYQRQQNSTIYPMTKVELQELLASPAEWIDGGIIEIQPNDKSILIQHGMVVEYTYLVNTISLPAFVKLCGWSVNLPFKNYPFWIMPIDLGYSTDLYQMVYNTAKADSITRATLLDTHLYLDMCRKTLTDHDVKMVKDIFSLKCVPLEAGVVKVSPGRFDVLPRLARKQFFYNLTSQHNIMTLGRYGSWSFKVANDVWDDTKQLCEYITNKEHSKQGGLLYESK